MSIERNINKHHLDLLVRIRTKYYKENVTRFLHQIPWKHADIQKWVLTEICQLSGVHLSTAYYNINKTEYERPDLLENFWLSRLKTPPAELDVNVIISSKDIHTMTLFSKYLVNWQNCIEAPISYPSDLAIFIYLEVRRHTRSFILLHWCCPKELAMIRDPAFQDYMYKQIIKEIRLSAREFNDSLQYHCRRHPEETLKKELIDFRASFIRSNGIEALKFMKNLQG